MAVDPVTPAPGQAFSIAAGGTPVEVFPAGIAGGFIQNPSTAVAQGIGGADDAAESLFISVVGEAGLVGNDITFELYPGETWQGIPGQTTATSVNAATSGHSFAATYWE